MNNKQFIKMPEKYENAIQVALVLIAIVLLAYVLKYQL